MGWLQPPCPAVRCPCPQGSQAGCHQFYDVLAVALLVLCLCFACPSLPEPYLHGLRVHQAQLGARSGLACKDNPQGGCAGRARSCIGPGVVMQAIALQQE